MKYAGRLALYIAIFFAVFSITCVAVLRVVPVTLTPLKVLRIVQTPRGPIAPQSKWRSLDNINDNMVMAVIASEDNKFLEHHGFDWDAIREAVRHNRAGYKMHGASTISQQTAKNVFCTYHRNWARKALESYYTVLIETLWGKSRIMTVYLNVIETHSGVYGVEATAQRFFHKDAAELNVSEASMIATILPAPRRWDLGAPSGYMMGRAGRIREAMNQLPRVDL